MPSSDFHPAVAAWFDATFDAPTDCQRAAWPAIRADEPTLIAAPTGSGKTLAAFLCGIDDLVRDAEAGSLRDEIRLVYVSPLRALSHDIALNLERPLQGIREILATTGEGDAPVIRSAVRTGDTPATARAAMRRRPPHILVTTPESLYVLLTSVSGREALASVRSIVVDEIHALVGTKRGAHLALTLERLEHVATVPPNRIGLSATQRPIEAVAEFLTGTGPDRRPCRIVDFGHRRDVDLEIELTETPLAPVLSSEAAAEIYDRIAELVADHRATLVFVNTRRMAERVSRALAERLATTPDLHDGEVLAHHGSLSREKRLVAERRLKAGEVRALVATASLELGIDVGDVDLVCQLGSTRSLRTLLQRVGRSGHHLGGLPKGRLFPETRDDLVECLALVDMARRGELDAAAETPTALDVLAQQIVAECASAPIAEDALFTLVTRATPYATLSREAFDRVVAMLVDGFATTRGRRGAYVHRDGVNRIVHGRRGSRLAAVTSGGAIPDQGDYDVVLEPDGQIIGTVNEDFAIDSAPGNVFQLGTSSWRVLKVEAQALRVADAGGEPPNMPFWFGEAPGRTDAASHAVGRLREGLEDRIRAGHDTASNVAWLAGSLEVPEPAARQAVEYLTAGYHMLGCLPTGSTLVLERFFDESGGMQLVLHSPLGARLNRAFGLALRKRFCKHFNFELQAAATDDAVVISLGVVHGFELADVWSYLNPATVRDVLAQAVLDAPVFQIRWRWVVTCALAVLRFRAGRKVPPQLQRMAAEDLSALVFPDQLACQENIRGPREIPEHPLVTQALADCLTEAMDVARLETLLAGIRDGSVRTVECDLTEPSPLAAEILSANPYAFLDDAPLEERRTRAVTQRRFLNPETARSVGRLDPDVVARVCAELAPDPRDAEELHDALVTSGYLLARECRTGTRAVAMPGPGEGQLALGLDRPPADAAEALEHAGRALVLPGPEAVWVAAERAAEFLAVFPAFEPPAGFVVPSGYEARAGHSREDALDAIVMSRLEVTGPVTAARLAAELTLPEPELVASLTRIECSGFALRGDYHVAAPDVPQWCERRILARLTRATVKRLRAEIEPVPLEVFARFAFARAGIGERVPGVPGRSLEQVLGDLAGFRAPAAAWETEILARRVPGYAKSMLDALTLSGAFAWLRTGQITTDAGAATRLVGASGVTICPRDEVATWRRLAAGAGWPGGPPVVTGDADVAAVAARLGASGPAFAADLVGEGLTRGAVASALVRLVAMGLVTADGFEGLRAVIEAGGEAGGGARADALFDRLARAGRFSLVAFAAGGPDREAVAEQVARRLVARYGIVCRALVVHERGLPPWQDVLRALRRLELAGEVRGGRFVALVTGEQFAAPEALTALKAARTIPEGRGLVAVSAVDPANVATLFPDVPDVPALGSNRWLFRHGRPAACLAGGEMTFLTALSREEVLEARALLAGRGTRVRDDDATGRERALRARAPRRRSRRPAVRSGEPS